MVILGLLVAGSVAIAATSPSPDPVIATPTPTPIVIETPTPTATPAPTPAFTPEPPAAPQYRAICNDGSGSFSTGRGTCSWHGGVDHYTGY